jgi:hypothetical protein
MFIKRIVAASAIAAGALTAVVTPGSAEAAPSPAQETMRALCEASRGDFFITPYNLARCQNVRSKTGDFPVERSVCEEQLMGEFVATPSFSGKPHRYSWGCS